MDLRCAEGGSCPVGEFVGGRRAAVGFCGGQPAGKRERRRRRRRTDTGKRRSGCGLSVAAGRLRKERFGEGDECVWAEGEGNGVGQGGNVVG